MSLILPYLLKYWKVLLGGVLLVGLYLSFKVLVHQRDAARQQAKDYAVIIDDYKAKSQVQKDKLDAALKLSQVVKTEVVTKIKYIQSTMPPEGAPDDAVRQWAIKMGQELP